MNSATNHFLILSLRNSYRGLNSLNKHPTTKIATSFCWEEPSHQNPRAPQHHHTIIAHEKFKSFLCWEVETLEGPVGFRPFVTAPDDVKTKGHHHLGSKTRAPWFNNHSRKGGSQGLFCALKVTLKMLFGPQNVADATNIVTMAASIHIYYSGATEISYVMMGWKKSKISSF